MALTAKRAGNPFMRARLRFSPNNPWAVETPPENPLTAVGEITEEWVVTGANSFIGNDPDGGSGDRPDDPLSIIKADGLPQIGDVYWADTDNSNWICAGYDNIYDTAAAVVDYSTPDAPTGTVTWKLTVIYAPNPAKLPTEIHLASNRVMKVVTKDVLTGESIVNSAGDPFNPQVQECHGLLRVRVVKRFNLEDLTGIGIRQFVDHVNDSDWMFPGLGTLPEKTVYCVGADAPLVKEPIWHYQAEFHFDIEDSDGTFQAKLLDCGYQWKDADGKTHPFASDDNYVHGGIGLLDGSGKKGDPATPVYLDFDTKPTVDFNLLNLF